MHAGSTLRPHSLFRGDPQGRLPHTGATHGRSPTRDTQKEPEVPVTTRTVGHGAQGRKSPEVKQPAPRPSPGDFWEWPRGPGVRKRKSQACGRRGPEAKGAYSGCSCWVKASPAGPGPGSFGKGTAEPFSSEALGVCVKVRAVESAMWPRGPWVLARM